jgi:hypothetical protein
MSPVMSMNYNPNTLVDAHELIKLLESLSIYQFALSEDKNFMIHLPVTYRKKENPRIFCVKVEGGYLDCPVPMVLINRQGKTLLCPFSLVNFVLLCELCGLIVKKISLSEHYTADGPLQEISLSFENFNSFPDTFIPLSLIEKIQELYTIKGTHKKIADCFKYSCFLHKKLQLLIEYADLDGGITDLIVTTETHLNKYYRKNYCLVTLQKLMFMNKIQFHSFSSQNKK